MTTEVKERDFWNKNKQKFEKSAIKLRIAFWYTGIIIGIVVVFLGTMFYINGYLVRASVHGRLRKTVENTTEKMEFNDGNLTLENNLEATVNEIFVSIYDDNKEFIYGDSHLDFEFKDAFSGERRVRTIKYEYSRWYIYEIRKEVPEYGYIWIRGITPASGVERNIELITWIFLAVFPFLLVISAFVGYITTKKAFAPMEKIRETAEKINAGNDLTKRINIGKKKDEISTLANTFDKMFDRLQDSFDRETQFTSDVSHELRTPISVISSQSQYGLKYLDINDETREVLENILDEADKMSDLVGKLLMLARMDKGSQKLYIENSDIGEIAKIAIETKIVESSRKNITIEESIAENIYVDIDKSMITRVFLNLIENSITYGKEKGKIIVEVSSCEGRAICKVTDDGMGIPPEHIERIWDRFYQVEPSRAGDSSGLGLSMVKSIIEAHKGEISVESQLNKGTTFTFALPLENSEGKEVKLK